MFPNEDVVLKLLNKLVSPKYGNIFEYHIDIKNGLDDEEIRKPFINITIYIEYKNFNDLFYSSDCLYPSQLHEDIEEDVIRALKFIGMQYRHSTSIKTIDNVSIIYL